MKKLLIVLGIVVVLGGVVFVSVQQAVRKGTKVYEEDAKRVDSLVSSVKASGEIQPKVYVNISSQVPGQIVELRVKEGDKVATGDILLQLDPEQYRSTVTRLEANLRMARINLEREKATLKTHEATLRRQEQLATSMIVSAESLDQARLLTDTTAIQIRAYDEQISQADADLGKARDELSKTTIRAPMGGLATRVNAKLGEQVIIGTMNNPGTVILVLSDMSEMLAEVRVDETEVGGVRAGQKAVVTVDAVEGRKFEGTVTEIAHTAMKDRDVSRFTVKITLSGKTQAAGGPAARELPLPDETGPGPAREGELRPGMSAHAAITVATREDAVVVPIQAVVGRKRKDVETALAAAEQTRGKAKEPAGALVAGESPASPDGANRKVAPSETAADKEEVDVVFLDRNGKAEMVQVKPGLSDEFTVELLGAPVQPGDKIVVGPYRTLKKLKHGEAVVKVEKDEDLKEKE